MNEPTNHGGGEVDQTPATALVIGGSRGIGRATALALARAGYDICLTYRQQEAAALEVATEIERLGVTARVSHLDFSEEEVPSKEFLKDFDPHSSIKICVVNAAATAFRPIMSTKRHHFERSVNANLAGPVAALQAVVPLMKEGGSIVFVSSLGSQRVLTNYGMMGIFKAAQESLMRYLAVELAPQKIRVNAVRAGSVESDSLDTYLQSQDSEPPDFSTNYVQRTPLGRFASEDDIANSIAFIASPQADYITGQVITVDGGISLPLI